MSNDAGDKRMITLFISHSSKDNAWALEAQAALKAANYETTFLDIDPEEGLHPGMKWETALYEKLRQAQAVVALCSEHWLDSPWCIAEGMLAREQGKTLFMLVTEKAGERGATAKGTKSPSVPDAFKEHQFISLAGRERDAAYPRLIDGLDRHEGLKREAFPPAPEPYPGLEPFTAAYAAVFCGREREIGDVKALLTRQMDGKLKGFILVLGASGSGKSSLVRAGVVPRVAGSVPEGEAWGSENALRFGDEWVVPVPIKGGQGIENGLAVLTPLTVGGRRRKDVAEARCANSQSSDHRWRASLVSKSQTSVRTHPVVMTPCELQLCRQTTRAPGMSWSTPRQIGNRSPKRQVQALDVRCIEPDGIFRALQRSVEPTRRSDHRTPFHPGDAVLSPGLNDLAIDAGGAKELADNLCVKLETVRRYQRYA